MRAIILFVLAIVSTCLQAEVDYFYLKKPGEEKIKVTVQDLEKLPAHSFSTATNFTPKNTFFGVKFKDFVEKYKISGTKVRAFAWDDYSYTISIDEMNKYDVIIAYKKEGKYIELSDLGPFAIIYPRDLYPELNTVDVNAGTVWQLKTLEIK